MTIRLLKKHGLNKGLYLILTSIQNSFIRQDAVSMNDGKKYRRSANQGASIQYDEKNNTLTCNSWEKWKEPLVQNANMKDLELKADKSSIPTSLSQLTDDETHRLVTDKEKNKWNNPPNPDLTDYAKKTDLDTKANKSELPSTLSQLTNDTKFKTETEIQEMIANSSKLKKEVTTSLPTTGKDDVIYLVKDTKGKDNNNYLEYLWIDSKWELIGSTQVDLSGYVKSEDIVEELCSSKNSELVANKKTYPFLDFLNRPVVMNNIEGNDWNTTAFTNGTRLYVSLDTKNAPNGDGAYIVFASYFLIKGNNESFSSIKISTTPVFVVAHHLNSGKMFFRKAYGGSCQKQIDEFTQGYTFSEWNDWKEIKSSTSDLSPFTQQELEEAFK